MRGVSTATDAARLTNTSGTATSCQHRRWRVLVTINGANGFIGIATDAAGNTAMTPTCTVAGSTRGLHQLGRGRHRRQRRQHVAAAVWPSRSPASVSTTGATVTVSTDGAPLPTVTTGVLGVVLTLTESATPYTLLAAATAGIQVGSGPSADRRSQRAARVIT
jgi:hypothetical protein